ncbi:2-amino-4-hydroxy-6-hydroxymethyldihydropteridinediphosphokinase [bacterium A37T11]|nr:2-amino-4-hydroxy-6-hydroxymethyldihydropteridinediphosphokinase [bacterium A37T11]
MHIVYLLLGSNVGDRVMQLQHSRDAVRQKVGMLEASSSVYETAAWGVFGQSPYLNQVLKVNTKLTPFEVLYETQLIERHLGRVRVQKWEARTIDIDILFYDQEVIETENLTVPHPLLHKRRFTLEPLNELASNFMHPVLQFTVKRLLDELEDQGKVQRFNSDYL